MSTTTTRPRGRPREFDEEVVLDAALEVFRTHGFCGATLDDLTAATGLNRPSLYGAFGNKLALFEACIDRYVSCDGARYAAALFSTGGLESDLRAFFRTVLDVISTPESGGCVVVCSLPAEGGMEPELARILSTIVGRLDRVVEARLLQAVEAGELRADAEVAALAKCTVNDMMALSLRARAGADRAELDAVAEASIGRLQGVR